MNRMLTCMAVASLLLLLPSCSDAPKQEANENKKEVLDESWTVVTSNAEGYELAFRATPQVMPVSEPFALEVRVSPADRAHHLSVEAVMPEHRHGMNVQPRIVELGNGRFRVEGMLFHMPGRWQLHFDASREAVTERAQLDVTVE